MDTAFGIGYLIGVVIWGIIWGVVAKAVITNKGYEEEGTKYFWLGFFFSFIPVIVAATKPQRIQRYENRSAPSSHRDSEREILSNGGWRCDCGQVNYNYVSSCRCGRSKWEVEQRRFKEKMKAAKEAEERKPEKSNAEQIKEYKELLDIGAITQEEFDAKKKQLLGL